MSYNWHQGNNHVCDACMNRLVENNQEMEFRAVHFNTTTDEPLFCRDCNAPLDIKLSETGEVKLVERIAQWHLTQDPQEKNTLAALSLVHQVYFNPDMIWDGPLARYGKYHNLDLTRPIYHQLDNGSPDVGPGVWPHIYVVYVYEARYLVSADSETSAAEEALELAEKNSVEAAQKEGSRKKAWTWEEREQADENTTVFELV